MRPQAVSQSCMEVPSSPRVPLYVILPDRLRSVVQVIKQKMPIELGGRVCFSPTTGAAVRCCLLSMLANILNAGQQGVVSIEPGDVLWSPKAVQSYPSHWCHVNSGVQMINMRRAPIATPFSLRKWRAPQLQKKELMCVVEGSVALTCQNDGIAIDPNLHSWDLIASAALASLFLSCLLCKVAVLKGSV